MRKLTVWAWIFLIALRLAEAGDKADKVSFDGLDLILIKSAKSSSGFTILAEDLRTEKQVDINKNTMLESVKLIVSERLSAKQWVHGKSRILAVIPQSGKNADEQLARNGQHYFSSNLFFVQDNLVQLKDKKGVYHRLSIDEIREGLAGNDLERAHAEPKK